MEYKPLAELVKSGQILYSEVPSADYVNEMQKVLSAQDLWLDVQGMLIAKTNMRYIELKPLSEIQAVKSSSPNYYHENSARIDTKDLQEIIGFDPKNLAKVKTISMNTETEVATFSIQDPANNIDTLIIYYGAREKIH